MVTAYTVLLTIHILAVATWLGGGSFVTTLMARAHREKVPERLAGLLRLVHPVASRVFPGAGLILVITGFWMIYNFGWPYDTWIILGTIGWAYSMFGGGVLIGPAVGKAVALFDERGPSDPEWMAQARRALMFARIDALVLTLMVVDMVIKPGT